MTRNERPRGVHVKVLDLTQVEDEALKFVRSGNSNTINAKIFGGPWAIAQKNNKIFAVCEEGVGPENGLDADDPIEFDIHGEYSVDGETHQITFDMFPVASVKMNAGDLLTLPVKEEVDLADFIRKFGSRLESNFYLWFDALS